jgi:DNA-binding phage protein
MTMAEKFHDFDPAEMLDSDEAIEAFLAEAMETNDANSSLPRSASRPWPSA